MLRKAIALFIIISLFTMLSAETNTDGAVLEEYPHLKKYLYKQKKSDFYVGVGIIPVGIMKNRFFLGVNIFQLHYINKYIDAEIFSTSFNVNWAQENKYTSYHFILRTNPKFRILDILSVGPIGALDFYMFPDQMVEECEDIDGTESPCIKAQPFSGLDFIWGVAFSEKFEYKDYIIQLNQFMYRQTYSTYQTRNGWKYWFQDDSAEVRLQKDIKKSIEAGYIFGFEISILL